MTVIRVGKHGRWDQWRVACHEAIGRRSVHQFPRPFNGGAVPIRFFAHQGPDPLAVDVRRPFDPEDSGRRELEEHIAHRIGAG